MRELGRDRVWQDFNDVIITRPVDKRENFIKRCVGIAGDVIRISDGKLIINDVPQQLFPQSERYYKLTMPANVFPDKDNLQELGINIHEGDDIGDVRNTAEPNVFLVNMTNQERANLRLPAGYTIADFIVGPDDPYFPVKQLFPYYLTNKTWTADNFGPLTVPKKGWNIPLTADNLIRYQRCIETYEGNKLETRNGQILINDKPATSYTFKMDYFWMMGDNRHNSLDSRYWGFVPEDHIVGKASLIWFSWENGPRWKRIFSLIK
jgi:signal peptidase I